MEPFHIPATLEEFIAQTDAIHALPREEYLVAVEKEYNRICYVRDGMEAFKPILTFWLKTMKLVK